MMKILGLMGAAEEQSDDASLFVNALRRAGLVDTERCFGFNEVRAKDEARALATKRLERQKGMSFMLTVF